ncbi:MAG: methylenetetrahydrofolate reductase [Chitinispirillaceae bacterium]|nr:methylenetetrahydrofolate reductase [Chitinispirillaceae bacterium]
MPQEKKTLQQRIESGKRIIITEIAPPENGNAALVRETAGTFSGKVHAIGVSDNRERIGMSALVVSALVKEAGGEPILHMSTRDRNRAALSSDCLGAHALGIRNILCTSGTHQTLLPFPTVKNVFDIDATVLLQHCRELERKAGMEVPFCLGAVASPFADPAELQLVRLAQKVHVGAGFFVTQPVFDVERFGTWCKEIVSRQLHTKAACIAGVQIVTDAAQARELAVKRPDPLLPEAVIERLEKAGDARAEGIALARETIEKVLSFEGVRGISVICDEDPTAVLEVLDSMESDLE